MVVESSEEGWEKSSEEGLKMSRERGMESSSEGGRDLKLRKLGRKVNCSTTRCMGKSGRGRSCCWHNGAKGMGGSSAAGSGTTPAMGGSSAAGHRLRVHHHQLDQGRQLLEPVPAEKLRPPEIHRLRLLLFTSNEKKR